MRAVQQVSPLQEPGTQPASAVENGESLLVHGCSGRKGSIKDDQ